MLPEPTSPLIRKLNEVQGQYDVLQVELNDPATLSNPTKMIAASKAAGAIESLVGTYRTYLGHLKQLDELAELQRGDDKDMAELAALEREEKLAEASELIEKIKDGLVAAEDNKVDSFFVEMRAGTGGDEAALFVRNLYEMYRRYCEKNGWRFEVSDFSESERGGFKEVIANIKGRGAYRHLQYEGGGHRVQRVPETETQGRIHTSAATVAVLPELADVKIDIAAKDVEEYGCRGGGPGGQNVNKVETGWYIKHKPSGLSFKMTEHKSQTQNKERAWALLRATLYETERQKQHSAQMGARKAMMGSGDRSQRIRTYNFPQNRCTDHRLGGEDSGTKNFNLEAVMEGNMDELVAALIELDKQQRLEAL
ncbi:MAG TPA: PCRF domain-containing protein [Tepidisphaeraceae bacterium]|jgi:peptide chain release factor 1